MKSNLLIPLLSLLLCFTFSCNPNADDPTSVSERFDMSPPSCDPSVIAASPFHAKHLRFARLLALSLVASETLREAVKDASATPGQDYFNEILVNDFLARPVGATTVNGIFTQVFENNLSLSGGETFSAFKSDLLSADPLLVIKIPDWFGDTTWNVQTTIPHVVSNIKGAEQFLYGFDENGNCFSKESYYEFVNYEVVVKTSEDYLWIEGQEFLEGFAHPCMSYEAFFNTYARPYEGHYLLKKRDMQQLFMSCAEEAPNGPPNPPPPPCLRDEGFDQNHLRGFQLASPYIINTLDNQPCLGGEETFDFQIDFLYAFRTEEAAAIDSKLPPLPLYGVRRKELVKFMITWHPLSIQLISKYYPIGVGLNKYDYMKQINPINKEWVREQIGEALYVSWNETDFQICTSTGVTTVTNTVGATLTFALPFKWLPSSTFNTTYTKVSTHTVVVTGAAVIPLGYNALGYCDPPTPDVPPVIWYPTGPQGLLVHYDYVVE